MSLLDAIGFACPDAKACLFFFTGIVIRWERIVRAEGERQTPASREPGREKTMIFTVRLGC
jgi:hypothetical protein